MLSPDILTALRALNDLDLGALAHKVGVTSEDLTQAHVEALCKTYTTDVNARLDMVGQAMQDSTWSVEWKAMLVADLGAKVRAALPQEPAPPKRPQPGDVVPWAEVETHPEDGALLFKTWGGCEFMMTWHGAHSVMSGPDDRSIGRFLGGEGPCLPAQASAEKTVTLVARDLGSDPEAWRAAMREWTANGNRPAPAEARHQHPTPPAPPTRFAHATLLDSLDAELAIAAREVNSLVEQLTAEQAKVADLERSLATAQEVIDEAHKRAVLSKPEVFREDCAATARAVMELGLEQESSALLAEARQWFHLAGLGRP